MCSKDAVNPKGFPWEMTGNFTATLIQKHLIYEMGKCPRHRETIMSSRLASRFNVACI